MSIQLIGGVTVVLEIGGLRLLTDPAFPAPGPVPSGDRTLTKTTGPAVAAEEIGPIDAVLLSHDQNGDNLDRPGRALLAPSGVVLTTPSGAGRLVLPNRASLYADYARSFFSHGHVTWRSRVSASSGNHRRASRFHSCWLTAGPPGAMPAASAAATYLRTVFRE